MGIKIVNNSETDKIFKPWQVAGLNAIEQTGRIPISSREVLEKITEAGIKISRASVIVFLKSLYDQDLVLGHSTMGKGGARLDYTFNIDRDYFNSQVVSQLMGNLVKEFPEVDHVEILEGVLLNYAVETINNPVA